MSDDELKKIPPQGDLELPRSRHNRFVDAARAHKSGKLRRQAGNRRSQSHANTAPAYNGSGEDVPRGGVVEIAGTSNTEAQVEFVKPGDTDGEGSYAVAVEPIPTETIARIATSGGPWQIRVASSVTPGQSVGPQDGSWDATTDGSEWDVVRGDVDGRAMVRFRGLQGLWEVASVGSGTCTVQAVDWDGSSLVTDSTREKTSVLYDPNNEPSEGDRGHLKGLSGGQPFFFKKSGGSVTPYEFANTATREFTGSGSYVGRRETYDGSVWAVDGDIAWLGKFDSPLELTEQTLRVVVYLPVASLLEVYFEAGRNDTSTVTSIRADLTTKLITEDFNISSISRSEMEALSGETAPNGVFADGAASERMTGRQYESHILMEYVWDSSDLPLSINGVAVYAEPAFDLGNLNIDSSPTRELFLYPPSISDIDKMLLTAVNSGHVTK